MLFKFPYILEKPVESLCFMKHKIISVCKFVNYVHIDSFFPMFVPNAILVYPLVDFYNCIFKFSMFHVLMNVWHTVNRDLIYILWRYADNKTTTVTANINAQQCSLGSKWLSDNQRGPKVKGLEELLMHIFASLSMVLVPEEFSCLSLFPANYRTTLHRGHPSVTILAI